MKIYNSLLEVTGNTPLVRLNKIEEKYNINNTLLAKVEMFNPSGSIKVRPARNMLLKALHENVIDYNSVVIEATSGNMGVALAFVCASIGLEFIAVMPENMSVERQKLILAYGAKIVLTKASLGMKGAVDEAIRLKNATNGFIPSQFDNINNPLAHYNETAEEIYTDTDGLVDVVVAGIGTGGTISGIGKNLKEKKEVKVIGVEPKDSPLLSLGVAGKHKIQGIGANFVPNTLDLDVVDYIETISDDDAIRLSRELATLEGLFVGISSGAALAGAIEYIEENNLKDKVIVVILPDTGERYLSTELVYE